MDLGFTFGTADVSSTLAYVGAFWNTFSDLIYLVVGVLLGLLVVEAFLNFRK